MPLFTFGAPPLPQFEEANDNPDMIGIQNLQIAENHLQVAAGGSGAVQVAAGGFVAGGVAAGGVAVGGVAGGGQTVNFPKVNYYNNPQYTPARMNIVDFAHETKTAMTFGGTSFITCCATSNSLKLLNAGLYMQYLDMLDTHVKNTGPDVKNIYELNFFLFGTFEDVLHPSRMVMFRIYKNFRDYIFKPVFLALYSTSLNTVPKELVDEPMKKELFTVWLNCTV